MGYKILDVYNQNVEISLIYEEIGQIMDSIYKWMDEIEDESTKQNIESRFPYFIKMYSKYQEQLDDLRTKIKPKNSVTFC
jgi:phage/plasmid-associated DNA primase